jgi:flagellar hook-associated protein 1 FlgK
MSLNHILSTATTGLSASQLALRTISNNIANVNTPGYARERVQLQALVAGGVGNGVGVSNVERITNRFLEAASYAAAGDSARFAVQQGYFDRLVSAFGEPGSDTGLAGRLNSLSSAAIALSADPADLNARRAFLGRVTAAIDELRALQGEAAGLRAEAESEIATGIERADTLLKRIETLNNSIAAAGYSGGSTASLAGQRAQVLAELGQLVSIRTTDLPSGAVEVATSSGIVLVDQRARQLGYVSPPASAGLAAYPPINVLRVDARGSAETTGETLGSSAGGRIGGLIDLRDRALPGVEDELAGLFSGLASALNAAHNAASAVPAPNVLDGRNTGLAAADRAGFGGAAIFAVTDASGAIVARTRIDFGALPATASISDVVAAINAGLGGAATASFADGVLRLSATGAANGMVVASDPLAPATRAGAGFAAFFGLNDVVAGAPVGAGVTASDPHGFAAGQTAGFQLRDSGGRILATTSVTMAAGGSFADILGVLNASIATHGSVSLDARGQLVFTPLPGNEGVRLSIISDSTNRAGTGISLGQFLGVAPSAARSLGGASVRADLLSNARNLALSQFDTSALVGQVALAAGDSSGAIALAEALTGPLDLGARGTVALSTFAAEFIAGIGADAGSVADAALDASARFNDAQQRRDDFSGVNLDEELTQMVIFQNSYAASARLISVAREMYDILLQLGE